MTDKKILLLKSFGSKLWKYLGTINKDKKKYNTIITTINNMLIFILNLFTHI